MAAGIAGSAAAKDDRAGNAAASNLVATHSPVNTLPIVDEETAEEPAPAPADIPAAAAPVPEPPAEAPAPEAQAEQPEPEKISLQ